MAWPRTEMGYRSRSESAKPSTKSPPPDKAFIIKGEAQHSFHTQNGETRVGLGPVLKLQGRAGH